jgi:hypothetical protein
LSDETRLWSRRFGGNCYTLLPFAVSSWAGFRANKDFFVSRKARLHQIVSNLTQISSNEAAQETTRPLLRFDPPEPLVSMIHVYLRCDCPTATAARDAAAARSGVSVFRAVRPGIRGASGQCYFEMNCGPHNGELTDEIWALGWRTFLEELRMRVVAAAAAV